jgi:uncharacterized alpha-E superfamily protein
MLSRTAENLYWMSRYIERAENNARILDVSHRMSLLPSVADHEVLHWRPALLIGPESNSFDERYGDATGTNVIAYMALDPKNPSSIYSALKTARENARAERTSITGEMWESLNATWLEIKDVDYAALERRGFRAFFDWIKERSHLFRGVTVGTMLKDDAFHFIRLGTFLERADNTARILDVKYHVLLPDTETIGGAVDYYQWGALLRSVSAFRSYRAAYRDAMKPWQIAELLVLRADMPRSLHACLEEVVGTLDRLAGPNTLECQRLAGAIHASLRFGRIERIFEQGLHEFLDEFIVRNNDLGNQIHRDFLMTAAIEF